MNPPENSDLPVWLLPVIVIGFLVFFPLFWCFVVGLLSRISGWQRLAKRYASGQQPVRGKPISVGNAAVGKTRYRHALTLFLADDGFFLQVMPLFRFGHPRLFIPFSEISNRQSVALVWAKSERLSIGSPPLGSITLPAGVIDPSSLS